MYSLILDSATKRLYACLVKDKKVLFERYIDGKNDHAKYIVSVVDEALKENNLKIDDINKVYSELMQSNYLNQNKSKFIIRRKR